MCSSDLTLLGKDVHIRTRAWPLELVNDGPTDPGKIADEVAALQAQVDCVTVRRIRSSPTPVNDTAGARSGSTGLSPQ